MVQKAKIHAEEGKQDLIITREFDLPLELLFRAYVEPEIVEQWMGTKVIKLECKPHGGWRFVTTDPKGNEHVLSTSTFTMSESREHLKWKRLLFRYNLNSSSLKS